MKSLASLVGLAAVAVLSPLVSADLVLTATSTTTATIWRTTTVTRSTCTNGEHPCTLSATPFVFQYSYPVSTTVVAEATSTRVDLAQYTMPSNGSHVVTVVPSTTVLTAGQTLTSVSWTTVLTAPATITLHITSTLTVGLTKTMTLPWGNSTIAVLPTTTSATVQTTTLDSTAASSMPSTTATSSCPEGTYSFGGGSHMPLSSYAPWGGQASSDTKSYSSTKYVLLTRTIPYPGTTETVSEAAASSTTSATRASVTDLPSAPYPAYSSSAPAGSVGTVGTVGSYPTDVPEPFQNKGLTHAKPVGVPGLVATVVVGFLLRGLMD